MAARLSRFPAASLTETSFGGPGTDQSEVLGYADSYGAPVNAGEYNLDFNGELANVSFYAAAGDVQSALEKLPDIGSGNVLVTGGMSGNFDSNDTGAAAYQVTFVGALGGQPQPAITVGTNQLTDANDNLVPTFAVVTAPGESAVDEVQQIEVLQTAGAFTLSLSGATVAVAVGSSDAELADDLASLPLIGSTANVAVSGSGTAADPYEARFIGSLAGVSVPQLSVLGSAVENTIHTAYNADGSIASIGDNYSDYSYNYDGQGNAASVDNSGSPNMPHVVLTSAYDAAGNRASLAANINGTPDFMNGYSYDELSRLIDITQQGQTGGNAVATKQVYYTLDPLGDVTGIYRSANTALGEVTV